MLGMLAKTMRTTELELPVVTLETTADKLAEKKAQLEQVLGAPFKLFVREGDGYRVIDEIAGDLLAGWINFTPTIYQDEVSTQ